MMTDRELLELAAKAAGYESWIEGNWQYAKASGLLILVDLGGSGYSGDWWNPLTDDGDALRLAVKLHIDIRHFMFENGTMDCIVDRIGRCVRESIVDDPYAATRRAIVRAAAEIGKEMK